MNRKPKQRSDQLKIVFSRKGFDSASGGGPSPIVNGVPVSLPIPAGCASATSYGALGLGEHAAKASKGTIGQSDLCHHDPMFCDDGICVFGQHSAAQTHLENEGVGIGDVFLFFGLFADEHSGEPHHRIFGYLKVDAVIALKDGAPDNLIALNHPHALKMHSANDVIWRGEGRTAKHANDALRLTVPGGPVTLWHRPEWLKRGDLSYHNRADRWLRGGKLKSVARGQEFVADIGRRKAPREWLDAIIAEINRS